MINPLIKTQLDNCKVANLPYYDDFTYSLLIPKGSSETVSLYQVHKCYIVELADWVIHPPADSTLADNWNKGSIPTCKYYKAEISQVVGKMIRITGCGYDKTSNVDTNEFWEGWIPRSGLKLVEELK